METVKGALRRYARLNLVLARKSFQFVPEGIIQGFREFCRQHQLSYQLLNNLEDNQLKPGEAFIVFRDADLIKLIKYSQAQNLALGQDLGIISYDDTPMKEILAQGITVISTDFEHMGRQAANFLLQKRKEKMANPTALIRRNSL
jgi:DNA-binding LacI/PurR family transcriptional regulator